MKQLVQSYPPQDVEKRCAEKLRQGWRVTHVAATAGMVHVVFEMAEYRPGEERGRDGRD